MITCKLPAISTFQEVNIALFKFGHMAVDVFIVISGYCLMLPATKTNYTLKGGALNFLKRRFIRIYPPYFIALAISVLAGYTLIKHKTGTVFDLSLPVTKRDIMLHLFLIHDVFYSAVFKINYVFWSIAVECRIYLLFPLLLALCRKWDIKLVFLAACVLSFGLRLVMLKTAIWYPDINLRDSGVHPYLMLFAMGMFAANFDGDFTRRSTRFDMVFLFAITGLLLLLIPIWTGYTAPDLLMGIFACWLIIAMQNFRKNPLANGLATFLSKRPVAFLGEFSYSIYLLHPIFIQILWSFLFSKLPVDAFSRYLLFVIAGGPLILFVCYRLFLVIEKPFLRHNRVKKEQTVNLETVSGRQG